MYLDKKLYLDIFILAKSIMGRRKYNNTITLEWHWSEANAMSRLRTMCVDLKRRHAVQKFFIVIERAVVFPPAQRGDGLFVFFVSRVITEEGCSVPRLKETMDGGVSVFSSILTKKTIVFFLHCYRRRQ
jgi:hypothetical protein